MVRYELLNVTLDQPVEKSSVTIDWYRQEWQTFYLLKIYKMWDLEKSIPGK